MVDLRHTKKRSGGRRKHCYDWQGVRLLLLGVGVLVVMLVVVRLTFNVLDKGVSYLVGAGTWPPAVVALVLAGLAGIAKVVKAFAVPMDKVVDIVLRRKRFHEEGDGQ